MSEKVKILIVEDYSTTQELYEEALGVLYELVMVSTLAEAKNALAQDDFQIAIVDGHLPDGTGYDLAESLSSKMKVVMGSGSETPSVAPVGYEIVDKLKAIKIAKLWSAEDR